MSKTKELCCGGALGTWHPKPSLWTTQAGGAAGGTGRDLLIPVGTKIYHHLSSAQHVDRVYKKARQRMFLLRRLKGFNVKQDILTAVYRPPIESVLTDNIAEKGKEKITRIIKHAPKSAAPHQAQL